MSDNLPAPVDSKILIYQSDSGETRLEVRLQDESVWLTQKMMAELFQKDIRTINEHIKNVYEEGELEPESTIRKFRIVQTEGNRQVGRLMDFYNLDMIISVGYRVKSVIATRFRQWATARLREYIVKGFTLDDERLKGGKGLVDYFDELLARIREIRASEARVYQRIREIFALARDYREGEKETQVFFATLQNKMHYAATGMTAAEIVRKRADAAKANMGLTTWKGGRVLKRDVGTAKNYLDAEEIETLNRITVMFLDQAEFRAQRRQDIRMLDWEAFLDKFLMNTELPVLANAGSVSRDAAIEWAEGQFDAFAERRRLEAESEAETRYVEDLRTSARFLDQERKKTPPKQQEAKVKKKGGKK
ncbi:virulence RhuM family protein [Desulfatiglans anilini]|uniref:virulence RhuM family protein n=1 Tax=Desulfatiglans anilini TaxID=90728 RepID=UPI0004290038|nr:virulence RhuM family protein [Desulfatiglans anilini]